MCKQYLHGGEKQPAFTSKPGIHTDIIARVRDALPPSVPVIGNGDIFAAEDAVRMMRETGCQGVMIARGAQGNPWIFDEIKAMLEGAEYVPPSVHERLSVAMEHAENIVREKGERVGVPESRKHMGWYVHGVRGAASARNRLMMAESLNAIREIFDELEKNEENI